MPIVKKREIEQLAQMNGEEIERFLKNLPATKDQMDRMFDFIEDKLDSQPCNHTNRFTMQFVMQNMMDFGKVSGWLSQNGGYCDCKILEEIAPYWRGYFQQDGQDT
ncbi:MAG: DUF2695 domain-containing protein [Acidobacteria bacterium]|nr:MAG: DUF2695 domain-containing protein [Acidobacteriota bacterium]REK02504.1 MAG: DUF2695 domain-containing protein [Acidobacteriota bacterium]REK13694.1 MAG: DUF2695 domain-containing protein [Acidobacteriota bacterium]REK41688.1 MAG: DUF2695 domain-containing protein [Acidobacteriota bacterium]